MTTHRRDFLNWLGATGAYAAIGAPMPPRVNVRPQPIDPEWDMSWTDRIKGKVRAVFDSPDVSEGAALLRALSWRDTHKKVYGTPPSEASAVVVFRHEGIALAMDDAYWARFKIGKEVKLKDNGGKNWATANPGTTSPSWLPPTIKNYDLHDFIASGGVVLACNLAFGDIVARYQKADKLSKDDARKAALAHLVPGVILQPSGIFAALCAQDAGCHYIIAS
ncbi:MAG: hypothetical protein ACREL5_05015 [Gemmatimonadales bacterium]